MKIDAESPNSTAFARASASSRSSKRYSDVTGPKTSSQERNASSATPSKSVGATRYASSSIRSPPASTVPPSAFPRSIPARISSSCFSLTIGPTSVVGSFGSPTTPLSIRSSRRARNSS